MCGVFGYIGHRKNAAEIILSGLKALEYRGYDSWGIAVVSANKINIKKKVGRIGQASVTEMPVSNFGFGHTRWATHGGVADINSHPHLDCSGKIAVIHNGIIENYEDLKRKLLGHKFVSETDSEVFAHLLEVNPDIRKVFQKITGLNAVVVMDVLEQKFVAARIGSPLVIGIGKDENFIASDPAALLPYTNKVHYLEDGEIVEIFQGKISCLNIKTGKKIIPKIVTLNWSNHDIGKGEYGSYMLKEIYEQPKIIDEISKTTEDYVKKFAGLINRSFGSYLIGCGTAGYAAIAGSYLFSKIAKKHINSAIGSEFGYQLDFLTGKSLVLALSQSGETMDTLEAVKKAKEKKAKIGAIVNVLGSSLYREANFKILLNAGPEKAVASTKAFTAKLAYLILLAYALAGKIKQGQKVLEQTVKSVRAIFWPKSIKLINKIARKIASEEHVYIVGRGLSFPASLETALKIKEVSYVHAEGLAAGELKHGTLALIEKGTVCMVFLPDDETYGANLAGAMELKARGGVIIGVSFKPHEIFDYFIPVASCREGSIIANVVVGQLLAYFIAKQRGLDVDMPRNLAKSVTVK